MSHPMENIIAETLLGTTSKEVGLARVACNAAASQQIFCSCGQILDQKRIAVITVALRTTPKRTSVNAICLDCWKQDEKRIREAAEFTKTPITIETWKGIERLNS